MVYFPSFDLSLWFNKKMSISPDCGVIVDHSSLMSSCSQSERKVTAFKLFNVFEWNVWRFETWNLSCDLATKMDIWIFSEWFWWTTPLPRLLTTVERVYIDYFCPTGLGYAVGDWNESEKEANIAYKRAY